MAETVEHGQDRDPSTAGFDAGHGGLTHPGAAGQFGLRHAQLSPPGVDGTAEGECQARFLIGEPVLIGVTPGGQARVLAKKNVRASPPTAQDPSGVSMTLIEGLAAHRRSRDPSRIGGTHALRRHARGRKRRDGPELEGQRAGCCLTCSIRLANCATDKVRCPPSGSLLSRTPIPKLVASRPSSTQC